MENPAAKSQSAGPQSSAPQDGAAPTNGNRKKALLTAAGVFIGIAVLYGLYWGLHGRFYESTDDAYVAGNIVQVTPQVAGTVIAINADDTDFVRAGDTVVVLDSSDAKVALDEAKAALAQTVRQVRSLFATNASLAANVELAQSQLGRVQADLNRRRDLARTGAVSYEELNHAETAVKGAQADLLAAKEKLTTNQAFTDQTSVADHPSVRQAAAKVHAAYLDYKRAAIPASVSGFIAKRSVQVGQRVAPGKPLMAIIPLHNVWVDANFKEGQVTDMRIGQPVKLEADIYGGKVEYHGKIVGLSAGTGSAFSLLPPQNATGNWIKVVQRIPVKVELDARELQEHPLRVGLSVIATVDIADRSGPQLASSARNAVAYQTSVYGNRDREADALVQKIIADNRGKSGGDKPAVARKSQSSVAHKSARQARAVALKQ
jgi:membrane fusion protein (multidrug efflux system)